jgi:translation initiation factor 2 subunit 1
LLEYNGKVGMMPINEYTTAMRKAIHRAMKVGKREILRVIRVDREKGTYPGYSGYIDLSKKQVNLDDEEQG